MALTTLINGIVSRILPQAAQVDGAQMAPRYSRYGEQEVISPIPTSHALADEGQYFMCTNTTLGTGIAFTTSITGYTAASPILIVYNSDGPGGKRIFLDYVSLSMTATTAAGTAVHAAVVTDRTNRWSSAGSVSFGISPVLLIANANTESTVGSIAQLAFGAPVATAASSQARQVIRRVVRGVATAPGMSIGDCYFFKFGMVEGACSVVQNNLLAGTPPPATLTVPCGPIVVGPGHSALLYTWSPASASAPSYEFDMGWWER